MKILDLFCGAGGAAVGYHRAFPDAEIYGIDIKPQPNYPFWFHRADANTFPLDGFDFIHASPPCEDHTQAAGSRVTGERGTGWMLEHTFMRLKHVRDVPWIIENVEGADMPGSFRICGSSFGLDVRRHRKFWANRIFVPPACNHAAQTRRFPSALSSRRKAGVLSSVVAVHGHTQYDGEFELRCRAMGIHWMTNDELVQAIPPDYTQWIGEQLCELA